MIFSFMHTASVHRTNLIIKRALQLLSPHFCLSRGLYEIMEVWAGVGWDAHVSWNIHCLMVETRFRSCFSSPLHPHRGHPPVLLPHCCLCRRTRPTRASPMATPLPGMRWGPSWPAWWDR